MALERYNNTQRKKTTFSTGTVKGLSDYTGFFGRKKFRIANYLFTSLSFLAVLRTRKVRSVLLK